MIVLILFLTAFFICGCSREDFSQEKEKSIPLKKDEWSSERQANPDFRPMELVKYLPDYIKTPPSKQDIIKDNIVSARRWEFAFLPDRLVANLRVQPNDRLACFIHFIDRSNRSEDFFKNFSKEKYKEYPVKRNKGSISILAGKIEVKAFGLLEPYTDEVKLIEFLESIDLKALSNHEKLKNE